MSSLLNRLYATDSNGFSAVSFSNMASSSWAFKHQTADLFLFNKIGHFIFHMIRCEMILSVVKLHSESINSLCSDVAWG